MDIDRASLSMVMNQSKAQTVALGITGNAGQQGFTKTNGVINGTTDVKQEATLNVMTKEDTTNT